MKPTTAFWLLAISPLLGNTETLAAKRGEAVTLRGKVVELRTVLKDAGVPFDEEPVAKQVVLRTPGGAVVPLISDEASRAFFVDKRLRDRPAEIHARRFADLPYVQVVSFLIEEDGQMRAPEYYCEICTISVRFPQTCPCCQGPMVLRMKPELR